MLLVLGLGQSEGKSGTLRMVYGIIWHTSMGMGLESGVLAWGERRKVNEGPIAIEETVTSKH